jgi:hypothetical protein
MARRIRCSPLDTALAITGPMILGQPWPLETMDFGARGAVLISVEKG